MLGDWHPFRNGFRITAGALYNGNKATLAASSPDFGLGEGSYRGDLKAEMGFGSAAPYLGIGWASGRMDRGGFFFFADAGAIFQGSPGVSVSGRVENQNSACTFNVSESGRATVLGECDLPDLRADLESEHADLEEDLDTLSIYPVVMLGVTYRF